jgi:hypothetical protein
LIESTECQKKTAGENRQPAQFSRRMPDVVQLQQAHGGRTLKKINAHISSVSSHK